MSEQFFDDARKVMRLANQEAHRFDHAYIGTEHILLGLIKEGSGVAAIVLRDVLGIDLRKVRLEIEMIVQSGTEPVPPGPLPHTPKAKKVIEFAVDEARRLKQNQVGTHHILLGLMREEEGVACQVLLNLGLKIENVREKILEFMRHGAKPAREHNEPAPKDELEGLSEEVRKAVKALDAEIERLNDEKEDAVAEKDFEKAARLRDEANTLKKKRSRLISECREKS